jgi:hypothetical protein
LTWSAAEVAVQNSSRPCENVGELKIADDLAGILMGIFRFPPKSVRAFAFASRTALKQPATSNLAQFEAFYVATAAISFSMPRMLSARRRL